MKKTAGTTHVVVDGSNIATEGRSTPSLGQLNDAVLAYVAQHPNTLVTVVVDATFGHRIDKSERSEFDAAIANNELVAPPAGAIGRGDAFILGIADKAGAVVLSNDSFQEFHGQYSWLFDPGRLIGGKPVPHVGWVFVERMPVRGPISRRSRATTASPPTIESPPTRDPRPTRRAPAPKTPPPRGVGDTAVRAVNDIVAFLDFAERHSAGSRVRATVHSYASHGAYVSCDGVKCYVPLRLMGSPPPSRARELMSIGDTVEIEIVEFAPVRRSIDCALVSVVDRRGSATVKPVPARRGSGADPIETPKAASKRAARKAAESATSAEIADGVEAKKAASPKRTLKSSPKTTPKVPQKAASRKKAAQKKAAEKKAAAVKKSVPKKAAGRKAAAKKTAPRNAAATTSPRKSTADRKSPPSQGRASRRRRVSES